MTFSASLTFGQGNSDKGLNKVQQKANKEKAIVEQTEDSIKGDSEGDSSEGWLKKERKEKGEKSNGKNSREKMSKMENGNAFGKEKEGMTGREFGQERAREARMEHQKNLNESIKKGKEKSIEARERILVAEEKNEKEFKAGDISEEEYESRKEKIEEAREKVDELEEDLKEAEEEKIEKAEDADEEAAEAAREAEEDIEN